MLYQILFLDVQKPNLSMSNELAVHTTCLSTAYSFLLAEYFINSSMLLVPTLFAVCIPI